MAKCVKGKECNGRCIKKEYNCRDKSKTQAKSKTKSGAKAFINDETLGKSASWEDVVLTDVNMAPKTSGKYGKKPSAEVEELAKNNVKDLFTMADKIGSSEKASVTDRTKSATYKALEEKLGGKEPRRQGLMLGLEGKKKSKKESALLPSEKELKEALQEAKNKAAKRDTGLMLGLEGKKSKTRPDANVDDKKAGAKATARKKKIAKKSGGLSFE